MNHPGPGSELVVSIPNPRKRKKIPIKLHQKIFDQLQPIVGLDHIVEYVPVSDEGKTELESGGNL